MDGVGRSWRDRISEHRTVERHTREVHDVPPEIIARLEALEAFAKSAAEIVNQCHADLVATRRELQDMREAMKSMAPLNHYHDYVAERVA